MKKLKFVFMLAVISVLAFSCSKENKKSNSGPEISDLVPKGEIVPVAQRQKTLTGFDTSATLRVRADAQKWWRTVKGEAIMFKNSCGGSIRRDDLEADTTHYHAFYPNGEIWVREGASAAPIKKGTWKWTNANQNAVKVVIDDEEPDPDFDNVYTITWLNDNNLVYVATIKHSENGCSAAVNVYIQFSKE